MSIIHLYYIIGTLLILLTIILTVLSVLSIESLLVFALAGILLLALGIIQHLILLDEKTFK